MAEPGTAIMALSPTQQKFKAYLEERSDQFAALLPKYYGVDRLLMGALVATQTNPDILKCKPSTVAVALARVAQWGLDVGVTAHLVPFHDTCTPVADYKGYIELMIAAGARKVEAREVRKGDEFVYRYGTEPRIVHQPRGAGRGEIIAAYAVVWGRGMVPQFEVMTADEINAIRAKSRQWNKGPLEGWYARKTVIRRLAKYVAKTPQLVGALRTDAGMIDPETGEILDLPPDDMPPGEPVAAEISEASFEPGDAAEPA